MKAAKQKRISLSLPPPRPSRQPQDDGRSRGARALRLVGGVSQTRWFHHLASFYSRLGWWLRAHLTVTPPRFLLGLASQLYCSVHRRPSPEGCPLPAPRDPHRSLSALPNFGASLFLVVGAVLCPGRAQQRPRSSSAGPMHLPSSWDDPECLQMLPDVSGGRGRGRGDKAGPSLCQP